MVWGLRCDVFRALELVDVVRPKGVAYIFKQEPIRC